MPTAASNDCYKMYDSEPFYTLKHIEPCEWAEGSVVLIGGLSYLWVAGGYSRFINYQQTTELVSLTPGQSKVGPNLPLEAMHYFCTVNPDMTKTMIIGGATGSTSGANGSHLIPNEQNAFTCHHF